MTIVDIAILVTVPAIGTFAIKVIIDSMNKGLDYLDDQKPDPTHLEACERCDSRVLVHTSTGHKLARFGTACTLCEHW